MDPKRSELTFDGFGINGPDEYRTRLATFTRCYVDQEAKRYGPLFAAAPDLLAACKYLQTALDDYAEDPDCKRKLKSDHAMEILAGRDMVARAIEKAEGK